DRRGRPRRPPAAHRHARRHRAGRPSRGVGRRGAPEVGLPHHVRRSAGRHVGHARRRRRCAGTVAMTAMPSAQHYVRLSGEEFRSRLREALDIYVEAMRYPPGTAEQRAPMWLTHVLREGWRSVAALDDEGRLVGIAYGYRGKPGQWWHEQVRRGVVEREGEQTAATWLDDYFELTEIHVRPGAQGRGTGEDLLRMLLDGVPDSRV